jgi:hypothetical protein
MPQPEEALFLHRGESWRLLVACIGEWGKHGWGGGKGTKRIYNTDVVKREQRPLTIISLNK